MKEISQFALGLFGGRWLLPAIDYVFFAVNLILDAWLLRVLLRQRARKELPIFFAYIVWELLATAVGIATWLVSRKLYVTVSWWMEAGRVALMVGAVWESLLQTFKDFKSLLRWSVLGVILVVLLYSAWKAEYAPPVQSSRLVSFILGAEFTFRWGIAGVAALSIGLTWLVGEPSGTREGAVVTGYGLASLAIVANVLGRSFFGTRFIFLIQYVPDMGYFVAVWYWIKIFSRPIEEFGFKELGMGPEEIRKELRSYGEILDDMEKNL